MSEDFYPWLEYNPLALSCTAEEIGGTGSTPGYPPVLNLGANWYRDRQMLKYVTLQSERTSYCTIALERWRIYSI